MNNLSKKIRGVVDGIVDTNKSPIMGKLSQVMKKNAEYLSGYGASEVAVSECHSALLTAIMGEIQKATVEFDAMKGKQDSATSEAAIDGALSTLDSIYSMLKEAREELTNNE